MKRGCTHPILVAGASHALRLLAHAHVFALFVVPIFGCEHALVDGTVTLEKEWPHESIVATQNGKNSRGHDLLWHRARQVKLTAGQCVLPGSINA